MMGESASGYQAGPSLPATCLVQGLHGSVKRGASVEHVASAFPTLANGQGQKLKRETPRYNALRLAAGDFIVSGVQFSLNTLLLFFKAI
ncbi:hypothetical protein H0A71_10560 [Alcaligenaceae bacterium]|nr:hypothetical protein [Alcaligenaceae bacterium]